MALVAESKDKALRLVVESAKRGYEGSPGPEVWTQAVLVLQHRRWKVEDARAIHGTHVPDTITGSESSCPLPVTWSEDRGGDGGSERSGFRASQ